MNKKFGRIKKIIHLSPEKKSLLWQSIDEKINFYEKNVRIEQDLRLNIGEGKNTSQTLYSNKKKMFVAIITGISVLFSGAASFAAETSLPGELLYPIKIYVNESVQSTFTFGAESEAELQLNRIEERIQERNQLEAEGKLTIELDTKIEAQINSHKQDFESEKETMQKEDKAESATLLDVRLSSLLSTFSNRSAVEVKSNTNISTDSNNNYDSSSGETNTGVEVDINVESNTNIDTKKVINKLLDATGEIQGNVEVEVDTSIDSTIDTAIEAETEIDKTIDTLTDDMFEVIESISIESNTNTSSSTKTSTSTDSNTSIIGNGELRIK